MSKLLFETDNYTISWYDDEKTIIHGQVTNQWTWEDAHTAVRMLNDIITSVDHHVYTIFHFENASMVPRGGAALTNLKNMIAIDPPNERLIFFVGSGMFLRNLIQVVGKMGIMRRTFSKYHFVKTLDEALQLIAEDKARVEEDAHS